MNDNHDASREEQEDGEISDGGNPKPVNYDVQYKEDGEIVDSCEDSPSTSKIEEMQVEHTGTSSFSSALPEVIPVCKGRRIVDYDVPSDIEDSSDEDVSPEEILNILEKKKMETISNAPVPVDPNMCFMCQKENFKYKCPRCLVKTCSLVCVNAHKGEHKCDGVRIPFTAVQKLSQYDASKSIEDQQFLCELKNQIVKPVPPVMHTALDSKPFDHRTGLSNQAGVDVDGWRAPSHAVVTGTADESGNRYNEQPNDDGTRNYPQCGSEKFLVTNAIGRRIWLSFSADGEKDERGSKHEHFSDTIFWRIDFVFVKQLEDGSISEYSYRVHKIPESIRLCTVLKQFLKPRKYGCIVSASDLDADKLAPFIGAGLEKVNLFMQVPRHDTERYYVMVPERTILENTRNRVILDHPRIIVTLQDEMMHLQTLSDFEAEAIRSRMQLERNQQRKMNGSGGSSHRGRGGPRGRGSFPKHTSAGRGGNFGSPHGFKRHNNQDDYGGFKRGRGSGFNRGGFRKPFPGKDAALFDPFEPFEGPVKLPMNGN